MQLQAQCFEKTTILSQETQWDFVHIYPQGWRVYLDQVVLTTKDWVLTVVVRQSSYSTIHDYHKRIKDLLDSELEYKITNGVIPEELSSCKKSLPV